MKMLPELIGVLQMKQTSSGASHPSEKAGGPGHVGTGWAYPVQFQSPLSGIQRLPASPKGVTVLAPGSVAGPVPDEPDREDEASDESERSVFTPPPHAPTTT